MAKQKPQFSFEQRDFSLKGVVIVHSLWHEQWVSVMVRSAEQLLRSVAINSYAIVSAPGTYELPYVTNLMAAVLKQPHLHRDAIKQLEQWLNQEQLLWYRHQKQKGGEGYYIPLDVEYLKRLIWLTHLQWGIVVLGCVLQGQTQHHHYISAPTFYHLQQIAMNYGIPITTGIITAADEATAKKRATDPQENKGIEATQALLYLL